MTLRVWASIAGLFLCFRLLAALPEPTGYVSDLAHVVSPSDKQALEAYCYQVEQQLGVQLAIVTVDSVGDTPIEDFALDLFRKWGIGSKKDNSGVLLLLAVKDHKSRIQTGRGVEPYLTDGFSGSTLRAMRPDLRAGDYGAALLEGARAMAAQIAQGKGVAFNGNAVPERRVRERSSRGISLQGIIVAIFVLIFIVNLFRRGGGGGGGFLTGMLLGSLLGSGERGRGGDGWGGGGFGGDSGGGGGFGGFGGGDTGGGGASSDW
jgi:uncharacterized protein